MALTILDTPMRMAAFEHVRRLNEVHDHLTANELKPGFVFTANAFRSSIRSAASSSRSNALSAFDQDRVPEAGRQGLVRRPARGASADFRRRRNDRLRLHGRGSDAADNRWLREAFENHIPIIYFLGIAPGRYQAMVPAFVSGWDATALKARVAFGAPDQEAIAPPENALERRYALRAVKQRLHQASFREAVITAYNGRCALSGLPESLCSTPPTSSRTRTSGSASPSCPTASRSRKSITQLSTRI